MPLSKPLSGYKVIDFGHYIAGPATGLILADFGAEVVSVVPPGGPRWNHPVDTVLSRNKRVIELDLKNSDGLRQARELARVSDVLIENFRPGVMDRLGLSYSDIASDNAGLVYLSLPGFASTDPERSHLRAFEAVISAASGQFTDMGLNRVLMGIDPSFSPITLASAYGAVLGANSVLFALLGRSSTGRGDHIEVPLASALMEGLAYNSQRIQNYPERYKSLREKEIARRRDANLPLTLSYPQLQEFLDPFYRSYRCSDGRMIYVVCSSHINHAKRCLKLMGLWEELQLLGIPEEDDWYKPLSEWKNDCALGHYPLSRYWADIVSKLMSEMFLTDTAFAWEQKFGEGRVPARAHRTTQEWLHTEHPHKAGLIIECNSNKLGKFLCPGPFAWLHDDQANPLAVCSSQNDTAEDVKLRWSSSPIPSPSGVLANGRPWLSGLKILDMTNVIAGPTISSFLSRFGPEIIKLDPTKPTFDPWNTIVMGMQAGRGKKSALVDIRSPEGRVILQKLIRWADLITINAVDRQIHGLDLDEASLKAINPNVVLCQVDAFGGPLRGPMSDHLGYDDTVQAMTGVMIRFGGGRDTPEEHAHFGTIDVLGGFLAAAAAGAALLLKRDKGEVRRARSSLTAAGQLIQIPFMYDFATRGPFDEPSGRHVHGSGKGYRFYRGSDKWFFLASANEKELEKLSGVVELKEAFHSETLLEQAFSLKPAAYWVELLNSGGFGAIVPMSIADLRDKYLQQGNQLNLSALGSYAFQRHLIPNDRWVELFAPCAIRPLDAEIKSFPPPDKYGEATSKVLTNLGYSVGEIATLIDSGAATSSWSADYLPA